MKRLLVILGLSLIFISGIYNWYDSKHHFRKDKWLDEPQNRGIIVEDLMKNYELVGMTEKEVKNLLGSPDMAQPIGDSDASGMSYNLGAEPGFISIDDAWLNIYFNEVRRVSHYKLITD